MKKFSSLLFSKSKPKFRVIAGMTEKGEEFYSYFINDEYVQKLVKNIENKDLWKLEKKLKEFNATAYSRTDSEVGNEKLNTIKVELECNCTKEAFINLLHTKMTERHGEWNKTYTAGSVLEKFSDVLNVQFWQYKVALMKNRDFLVVRRMIQQDDGTILCIDRSIDNHPKYDEKKFLRCNLYYNIRMFKPQKEGPAKIFYMNKTDIGGSIPIFLSNSANVSVSSEEMVKICEILEHDSKNSSL